MSQTSIASATYLGQALLDFAVRPMRAGYVVRTGSKEDFLRAVQMASSRWGGMQEPILPVSASGTLMRPAWRQVMDVLQPDLLVNVAGFSDGALEAAQKTVGTSLWQVDAFDKYSDGMHQLATFSPEEMGRLILPLPERAGVVSAAAMGLLPDLNEEKQGWRDLGVRLLAENDPAEFARAQLEGRTIIATTVNQCADSDVQSFLWEHPAVVWIANPGSLVDATWFWNVRALTPRIGMPAPMVITTASVIARGAITSQLHRQLADRWFAYSRPDVVCTGSKTSNDVLHACAKVLGLQEYTETTVGSSGGTSKRDLSEKPLTYLARFDPRVWAVSPRSPGKRSRTVVQVTRPTTTVHIDSPVAFGGRLGGQLRVRMSGPRAMDVPRKASVAQLFHPNGVWRHDGIELVTQPIATYWFELRIPELPEVLTACLAEAGVVAKLSAPGSYATGVAALTGDAKALGTRTGLRIVAELTTPRSKRLERAIAALQPSASADDVKALAREFGGQVRQRSSSLHDLRSRTGIASKPLAAILDLLVQCGAVVRGFRVSCTRCGMVSFTTDGGPKTVCPGCGLAAPLVPHSATGEPGLYYQLNALVDAASDHGALGHVYAIQNLLHTEPDAYIIPGADIHSAADGIHLGEVDLVGLSGRQVIAGEVKTSAGGFTDKQIERDVAFSRRLGADRHVMVCLEELPHEVMEAAKAKCDAAGMELTVITGSA